MNGQNEEKKTHREKRTTAKGEEKKPSNVVSCISPIDWSY